MGKISFSKAGSVDFLRDQLRNFTPDRAKRTEWGDGWILMSFLTDCYTPSEAKHRLTRQCLELFLDAGHKVRVQTRSALAERDFDLFTAHRDRLLFGTSLPHLDDSLCSVLEPRAAAPTRRLRMLERAADAGIPVYVAIAPFLPFHTDKDLGAVLSKVFPLRPREVFCEVLNPKGENLAMMVDASRLASLSLPIDSRSIRPKTSVNIHVEGVKTRPHAQSSFYPLARHTASLESASTSR